MPWDETDDYWRHRIREPELFHEETFKTVEITEGVKAVMGKLKADEGELADKPMKTQSVLFSKEKFEKVEDAKDWYEEHKDSFRALEPGGEKRGGSGRTVNRGIETRSIPPMEMRVEERDGELSSISGYGALFNSWTWIGDSFREMVLPGAFTETIEKDKIKALWNHDRMFLLGSNRANPPTLELLEDKKGLKYIVDPPKRAYWLPTLVESIQRGDTEGSSFSFMATEDRWETDEDGEKREVIKARVFDLGPVTFEAYEGTEIAVRSALVSVGIDVDSLSQALAKERPTEADVRTIEHSIEVLRRKLPSDEPTHLDDAARLLQARKDKQRTRAEAILRL
jgi:hypothetical protein